MCVQVSLLARLIQQGKLGQPTPKSLGRSLQLFRPRCTLEQLQDFGPLMETGPCLLPAREVYRKHTGRRLVWLAAREGRFAKGDRGHGARSACG
jgi:hypothetical protein